MKTSALFIIAIGVLVAGCQQSPDAQAKKVYDTVKSNSLTQDCWADCQQSNSDQKAKVRKVFSTIKSNSLVP